MRFVFRSKELIELYNTGEGLHLHPSVIHAFFKVMARIRAAHDVNVLRSIRGLHLEKLRGDRAGQYSIRLNIQFRLVFTVERDAAGHYLLIIELVDYH